MKVISLHLGRCLSSRVDWLVPCGSGRTICGNGDYIPRLVLIVTHEVASFTMIQSSLGIEHRSIQLPWQMLSYPGTFARYVLSESPIMYPLPPHAVVVVLVRLKPSERVLSIFFGAIGSCGEPSSGSDTTSSSEKLVQLRHPSNFGIDLFVQT